VIRTDDYGAEFSWNLKNDDTDEVLFTDADFEDREVRLYEGCLANDVQCHTMTIRDSGANPGFCCNIPDNGDEACCGGRRAGFGVIFGTASVMNFNNPTFEDNSVTLNLCQPESETAESSQQTESDRTLSQKNSEIIAEAPLLRGKSQSSDSIDYVDTPTSRRRLSEETKDENNKKKYIRGVNLGGWLMAERFIAPYLFAVNSCHLQGSLCWYPGQMGAPENLTALAFNATAMNETARPLAGPPDNPYRDSINTLCDPHVCKPILSVKAKKPTDYNERGWRPFMDYPVDEWTLGETLRTSVGGFEMAQKYMERHWDAFLTYDDLHNLKKAGVTHLRIPISYWIRGDILQGEPYIPGGWPYFVRAAKWCRKLGLVIWADLHGAPGSENGFDNSGIFKGVSSCQGWDQNPANVERTVNILTDIAQGIVEEGLEDVVRGFGVLNEPFVDCDQGVVRNYYDQAFSILRNTLGEDVSVFVGDTFRSNRFNDRFWTDSNLHHDTYLDSHPYHVFFEQGRSFTPRQHIAYVCRHDTNDVKECCWEDPPNNTIPSKGISRIIGEWSGAYDALPTAMTPYIMKQIEVTGRAPYLNRTLSRERKEFLRNFVEAQMVAYEARDTGISSGWLFWNFKME
jgi:glucan 1,3-beta-glucosidase